jgi:hypothetical protein
MLLSALIVLLIVFIFLGMEVSWAIGMACLAYLVLADLTIGHVVYRQFPHYVLDGVDSFALLAIPLFLFAGELMTEAGVTQRLVRIASAFVGHIRGGLANVGVVSNFVMAGISGSAIADAASERKGRLAPNVPPEPRVKGVTPVTEAQIIRSSRSARQPVRRGFIEPAVEAFHEGSNFGVTTGKYRRFEARFNSGEDGEGLRPIEIQNDQIRDFFGPALEYIPRDGFKDDI